MTTMIPEKDKRHKTYIQIEKNNGGKERMKKKVYKAIAYLLSAVLIVGIIPFTLPQAAIKAEAEGIVNKKINFGADVLIPTITETENIFFYGESDTRNRVSSAPLVYYGFNNPKKWFVIGNNEIGAVKEPWTVTLFAAEALKDETGYDSSIPYSRSYANSDIKTVVDGFYDSLFSPNEQISIQQRILLKGEYNSRPDNFCDGVYDENGTSGYLWLLSTREANQIGQELLAFGKKSGNQFFWLRSPGKKTEYAIALVTDGGKILPEGIGINTSGAVRPAFNLNLSYIILTSAAEGGKVSGDVGASALMPVGNATNDEWKLTIYDHSRDELKVWMDGNTNVSPGSTIKIKYNNATTGKNEYLSAILVDSNDNILYYGRLKELNSASLKDGEAEINLPSLPNGRYTIKFLSEQYNGDKMTDYASSFHSSREINLLVTDFKNTGKSIQMGSDVLGVELNSNNAATLYYDSYEENGVTQSDKWRVFGWEDYGIAGFSTI